MKIFKDDSKVDDDFGEWGTMCNRFLSEYNNKEVFEKYVAAWVVGLDNCEIWADYRYNTSNNYSILFDPEPSTFDAKESCNSTDENCVVANTWWAQNDT